MTMSFDDWKEGRVTPASVDIRVVDARSEKDARKGDEAPEETGKKLKLVEVLKVKDSILRTRVIEFAGKTGKVKVAAGESVLVEPPKPTNEVEWSAGDAPERIGDKDIPAFSYVWCKRGTDGTVEWRLYKKP